MLSIPETGTLKLACSQVIDSVITLLFFFPKSQVFLEELNDALGVTEVVLLELIDLVEGLLKGGIGELASLLGFLKDLVVEHGEVQGESELDGVACGKIDGVGFLVGGLSLLLDILEGGILGVLSDIAIVITDHLDEESLGLIGAISIEDAVVDHVNDLLAVSLELLLNVTLVGEEGSVELAVLGVLLDGRDGAASGALAADEVLEGDGQEVTLVSVDGATLEDEDLLKEVNHVFEALGLLSYSSEENLLVNCIGHLSLFFLNLNLIKSFSQIFN